MPKAALTLLEAVKSVLDRHPLVRYQQAQIDVARGNTQQASAAFDTVLQGVATQGRLSTPLTLATQEQYALIGLSGSDELSDLTQLSFGASKLFRSGITLAPSITLNRNVDNLLNPNGINTAVPTLQFTLPLLRGRGRSVVAAQEHADQIEESAAAYDLTQQVSQLLTNAVGDYWNLLAAEKLVAIAREAEDRARTDVENTQTLVDADQLPRANLNEVKASLSQSASTRIGAEQGVASAQYQLAVDIAMDSTEAASKTLTAVDEFPQPGKDLDAVLRQARFIGCVDAALKDRSDYIASAMRIKEQKVQVVAARNRLQPQLNLTVNGGYQSLQEGHHLTDFFTSPGSNVNEPTVNGGISYNFAPRNDQARGLLLQALATQTQLESQSQQLAHTIGANVLNAAAGLRHTALQEEESHAAVQFYRASLDAQRQKYDLGSASVIDLLSTEDRLTAALTADVEAELSYAMAMLQFRFQTGTLIEPGKMVQSIDAGAFENLPALDCLAHTP